MFLDVTDEYSRNDGGQRHVRTLNENCWISVLYRMTGFGHMEWETAICFCDPSTGRYAEGSPFIVQGDWRNELADMPECELRAWYAKTRGDHPIMFDAILGVLRQTTEL